MCVKLTGGLVLLAVFFLTGSGICGATHGRHGRAVHRPVITKIDPTGCEYLFPGATNWKELTLHVLGAGFQPDAVIWLGKTPLPTTFVSATELEATASFDVVTREPGVPKKRSSQGWQSSTDHLLLTVLDPTPNGRRSRPVIFTRTATIVGG